MGRARTRAEAPLAGVRQESQAQASPRPESPALGALAFTVYGSPVAQGRPRAARLPGGKIHIYNPASSRDWRQHVRVQALVALGGRPRLLEGPLELTLSFEFARPKSAPKRRIWPDRRPDLGNCLKSCEDALIGVAFRDDAQIVRMTLDKHYGPEPGVAIRLTPLSPQ